MNYVYFNNYGNIVSQKISNLYQSAFNVDDLYIFADFDTNLDSSPFNSVTISFQRADSLVVGEVEIISGESTPVSAINPVTGLTQKCKVYSFGESELSVAGNLGITIRYKVEEDLGEDTPLVALRTKVTGYVTAYVNKSVVANGVNLETLVARVNSALRSINNSTTLGVEDIPDLSTVYALVEHTHEGLGGTLEVEDIPNLSSVYAGVNHAHNSINYYTSAAEASVVNSNGLKLYVGTRTGVTQRSGWIYFFTD